MSNDLRLWLWEKKPYEPLLDAAQRIWSESFGMSRRSGTVGLLVWGSRPNLRKRRSAVNLLVTPTRKRTLAELELSAEKVGYGQKGMRGLPCNCGESFCRKRARRVSERQPVPSITLDFGRCVLGEVALREGG